MADGAPGASPAELGITPQDMGIKSPTPKTPIATPVISLQPQPQFIRQFSRAGSSEERSALAAQIREKRSEHFQAKAEKAGKEAQLEQGLQELADTEAALQEIPESWFGRAMNHRRLQELRASSSNQEYINQSIRNELSQMAFTEKRLTSEGMQVTRLDQARDMVNKFYKKEKDKWADTPYEKEDVAALFSDEHLASLSTEDYIALLRRFPSDMVTHVTRQGVRDHFTMREHDAGLGQFHNGFKNLLKDGRLISFIGAYTKDGVSQEALLDFLNSVTSKMGDPKIAVDYLDQAYNDSTRVGIEGKNYHDRSSVHLAAGEVADKYYGAEDENEIFFAFPTTYITSQHFFGGETAISEAGSSDTRLNTPSRNNIYVWSENNEGISINAGFVFIPLDAQVDRNTGSKYAMDENNQPTKILDADGKETYQLATETITSQEYWENYFREHPEQRPKRVIYYEGGNPTEALLEWRKDNGLVNFSDSDDFDFPENKVEYLGKNDPRAHHGEDRFRSLAERAIETFRASRPELKVA